MGNVREGAPKRAFDEDGDGDCKKKFKTDPEVHELLPTAENIRNVKDTKKWNILPSIVYELLALLKKSEKLNSVDDKRVCKHCKRSSVAGVHSRAI